MEITRTALCAHCKGPNPCTFNLVDKGEKLEAIPDSEEKICDLCGKPFAVFVEDISVEPKLRTEKL